MVHTIITPIGKTKVVEITQYELSGLLENGYYTFHVRQGFYIKQSSKSYRTSLIVDGVYYSDCDKDLNIEFTEVPSVFRKFNSLDLFGGGANGIQDTQYYVQNYSADEATKSILEYYKISTDVKEVEDIKKYDNYYFALWYISKVKEQLLPFTDEFHTELKKYFKLDIDYSISPKILGSLNSMLNGEFNAIPFKFLNDEQKRNITLEHLLNILKVKPNSEYNYKLKTRINHFKGV